MKRDSRGWSRPVLDTTSISTTTCLRKLGQHSLTSPLAPPVKTLILVLMSHDGLY